MQLWLVGLASETVLLSALTFLFYAWDKRQACRKGWRVPEHRLHVLSLLGGWPGALLGQCWLRHKSIKRRFRVVFWLTVIGHVALVGGVSFVVWSMSASR